MTTIYVKDKDKLPERRENDHYPTEMTLVNAILRRYAPSHGGLVLDIGAGDGRWAAIASWLFYPHILSAAMIDIKKPKHVFKFPSDVHTKYYEEDFLGMEISPLFDLVLSNPPYYIAEECIRKGWECLAPGGRMIMLLRLSFLAGIGRVKGLWEEIPPSKVAVCSRRPSFYGGKTSGTDFAVYIWDKKLSGNPEGTRGQFDGSFIYYDRDTSPDTQEKLLKLTGHPSYRL